jgi:hypothetical protein
VKVRSKLVNNKDLEDEVKEISGLITTKIKPDSTVVKTEKRTTTTTVYTEFLTPSKKRPKRRAFSTGCLAVAPRKAKRPHCLNLPK